MGRRLENLQFDTTYYPVVGVSCVFFLYFCRYVSPKLSSKYCPKYNGFTLSEQIDWDTRVTSTLHSVMVSCVCVYTMVSNDEITEEPIWWDAPVVRSSCAMVVGYLASDAMVMIVYYKNIGDMSYLLHHGVSIYAYYYVTSFGVLPYFANYRLVAEVSTPIVNQRWFLAKLGYSKSSPIFVTNGLVMVAMFFVVRIAVMPSYWQRVYRVYNTPGFNKLGYIQLCMLIPCLVLDILNLYWFYKMCSGAYKVINAAKAKEEKPVGENINGKLIGNAPVNNGLTSVRIAQNHHDMKKHID